MVPPIESDLGYRFRRRTLTLTRTLTLILELTLNLTLFLAVTGTKFLKENKNDKKRHRNIGQYRVIFPG